MIHLHGIGEFGMNRASYFYNLCCENLCKLIKISSCIFNEYFIIVLLLQRSSNKFSTHEFA